MRIEDAGAQEFRGVIAGAAQEGFAAVRLRTFARRQPLGTAGAALMAIMVLAALGADLIATHDPTRTNAAETLAAPGREFWLGTDHLGRDIWSRIVYGARVSLVVGLASTMLSGIVGGLVGLLSGYLGGRADLAIQRLMDIMQGLPAGEGPQADADEPFLGRPRDNAPKFLRAGILDPHA